MPAVRGTIELVAGVEPAAGSAVDDGPHAAVPEAEPMPASSPRRDPVVLVAGLLVLVPALVAAVSALRNPWIPTNDWALIELQVRRVGTGDTPLVGVYSRFGWRHPGPLFLYALALPYRLAPDDRGLLFAASCVNLAATVGFVLVVIRYRRTQALVALFGLAVLLRGLGIDQLGDPWNPTILIVPFALYLVLCLEIAVGRDRWPIPVALGVASFVVQAHVGLLQPVALLGLVAVGLRWIQHPPRPRRGRIAWRPVVPAALVLLGAWLAPVIDQLNGSGNIGMMARWARGDEVVDGGVLTEGRLGRDRILDAGAWLLEPAGLWVGRFRPVHAYGVDLLGEGRPVVLLWIPAVLGLALAVVRWAPLPAAYRWPTLAAGILAATGVVSLFTDLVTARGLAVFPQFRWTVAVVMLVWIALGWALAGVVVRRFPWLDEARPQLATGGLMVAAVALPVVLAVSRGPVGRQPVQTASEAMLRLEPAIVEYAAREPLVVANTKIMLNDKDLGLPVILERAGIPWIERDDPRAAEHRLFLVAPIGLSRSPYLTDAIAAGTIDILATSGPPPAGQPPDAELILLRLDPGDPARNPLGL